MANENNYLNKANQIWKMLDEMAQSNPQSYRTFVEKQMKEAKVFFAKPAELIALKANLKNRNVPVYINVCSWPRVPVQEKPDDPMPVTGGKLFDVEQEGPTSNGKQRSGVAVVALNPASLGNIENEKKNIGNSDLIQLVIDVVESQNENVALDRNKLEVIDKKFYGNFSELIELTFPGISKQSQMPDMKGLGDPSTVDPSILLQPSDVLQEIAAQKNGSSDNLPAVLPNVTHSDESRARPLIEEIPATDLNTTQEVDSSEVEVTYDENSFAPDKVAILVKLPESWKSPALQDCFIKKPNIVTIIVSTDRKPNTDSSEKRRVRLQVPFSVEEIGAVAKYTKKSRLLKITARRSSDVH